MKNYLPDVEIINGQVINHDEDICGNSRNLNDGSGI
jgi:hypothetical protein